MSETVLENIKRSNIRHEDMIAVNNHLRAAGRSTKAELIVPLPGETKKSFIDVRGVLENVLGLDVYSDGPRGQKTSVFLRGMNSNHTLVLLNGIAINDQSSPKAMFDFGYDFLQGIQQIELLFILRL